MTVYPTGIDSFTTKVDGVDDVLAEYVNVLQSGIVALETTLGTGTTNFVAKAGDTMTGNLNLAAGVEITAEANFQATASANTIFVGGNGIELNNQIKLKIDAENKDFKKYYGLIRANIANVIKGVKEGFEKKLPALMAQPRPIG